MMRAELFHIDHEIKTGLSHGPLALRAARTQMPTKAQKSRRRTEQRADSRRALTEIDVLDIAGQRKHFVRAADQSAESRVNVTRLNKRPTDLI